MNPDSYGLCNLHQRLIGKGGKCADCADQEIRANQSHHFTVRDTIGPITDSAQMAVTTAQCNGERHDECPRPSECACGCHRE